MLVELRKYLCLFMCLLYSSKALASINSLPGSSKDIFKTFSFCKLQVNYSNYVVQKYWFTVHFTELLKLLFGSVSTELNCGGSSRQRKVTVRNPAKQVTDCTYTIKPYSSKVCQVSVKRKLYVCLGSEVTNLNCSFVLISIWFWLNRKSAMAMAIQNALMTNWR